MSYDLAFWSAEAASRQPSEVFEDLLEDRAGSLPRAAGIVELTRRIRRDHPDWLDGSGDRGNRGRYVFLTMPYSWARGSVLNGLHDAARELDLIMFDAQVGAVLADEDWYEVEGDEPLDPSKETLSALARACGKVARDRGFRRIGRRHDWRRGESVLTGFGFSYDPSDGMVTLEAYAMCLTYLDYVGWGASVMSASDTTAWRGSRISHPLPNEEPARSEAQALFVESLHNVLFPELDRATDEWVYAQLVAAVRKGNCREVTEVQQLLVWAASLGRSADAELALSKKLADWEPWMSRMPVNAWTIAADVHERFGGFRLPPRPERVPIHPRRDS